MKKIFTLLALLPVLNLTPLLPAFAQTPDLAPKVAVRILPEFDAVKPGQTIAMAVEQTIEDHWHVYWKNPGDSGEATRIRWVLPDGVTAGDIQWPIPERIAFGPLLNFGYNKRATYLVDLTIPSDYKASSISGTADIELLVCNEICIPETKEIKFDIPVTTTDANPTDANFFANARAKIPETVAWQGLVEEANNALMLSFKADPEVLPLLSAAKSVEFYPEEWGIIQNPAPQIAKIENGQITLTIPRDTRPLTEIKEIKGVLVYETTDGVRKGYNVQTPIAALPQENSTAAIATATDDDTAPAVFVPEEAPMTAGTSTTLMQALLFAFFGGLILNLMPCVFPILSMKALSLVRMSDKEQHQAVFSGIAYTLGVLSCFALIAGVLIVLQKTGENIGWGFQLQNPVVVLLLSYILFIVGLNLSGMFEFTGRLANIGQDLTQKKGYTGSFFTGALATIVATPCTAPFMGIALGYALLQPPVVSLAIFLALGFGLALPYLLLCVVPALRKALPRPGLWMETFRQFLAFPMFASAAWLLWVYGQQVEGYYAGLMALLGAVFIAMGIWMWQRAPSHQPARSFIHAIAALFIIIAVSIASISMAKMPMTVAKIEENIEAIAAKHETIPFSPATLENLLAGKDPVFVEMTASWCITCKVNERIALATEATQKLFKEHNVAYIQGDWTNQNPEITNFLKSHGRNGVPLYVFYGERDPTTNTRPDPVVLPQLLTNGLVADIVINQ